MNQEKIGKFIKDIRLKNNLSQREFADILGVTFQAVSKWENGKNLPDMLVLKEISNKFNVDIDEIINAKRNKIKYNKFSVLNFILIVFLIVLMSILLVRNKEVFFSLNEIKSSNNDFKIIGSVARSETKASLIITEIKYNGKDDNTVYKNLDCILYGGINGKKIKLGECEKGNNKTLKNYLENLKLKLDNYDNKNTLFKNTKMYIEISLNNDNLKTISYIIPIEIN